MSFVLSPLPSAAAASLRSRGGITYTADEYPGYPCRHCLRDAAVGEELLLVSFSPFSTSSPYRTASPIFVHKDACPKYDASRAGTALPPQLTIRQLSVRSFDRDEMMLDAAVIDGTDLEATIHRLFAEPTAQQIHVHNATRGCWATTVRRA